MAPDSIGATLEQRRLVHRAARLQAALHRLRRIAEDTKAAGREVPLALRAAERTFTEELDTVTVALRRYDRVFEPSAKGA